MPLRPPQHRATARAVLVSKNDDVWDADRLTAEVSPLEGDKDAASEHPYVQYHRGATRFDLSAQCRWKNGKGSARDYFREGVEPDAQFILRRIDPEHMAEIRDAIERERGQDVRAWNAIMARACRLGLAGIEGAGWEFSLDHRGGASAETMRQIYDAGDLELVNEIGWAVYGYSSPLSYQEKKA